MAAFSPTAATKLSTRSIRQTSFVNINTAPPGTGVAGRLLDILFGRTADTRIHTPFQTANYNALQTRLDRRFSSGVLASLVYTYSKAIAFSDNSDSGLFFNTPAAMARNRAITAYDRTHNMEFYTVAELPFGAGKRWANSNRMARVPTGGWQVNAVFSAYSGTPFTIGSSGASLNAPGNSQVANLVKTHVEQFGKIGQGSSFFDPLACRAVTDPRFGNAGLDILRGPGLVNLDFGLFRDFRLTERFKFQFRTEAFNLTNTPHFNNPGRNVSNMSLSADGTIRSLGGFSEVTSARDDQRQFRFALRFSF